jgi:hypothetical protein
MILKSLIDSTSWDIEVSVFTNFHSFQRYPVTATFPFIINNRGNHPISEEPQAQSGNPPDVPESVIILLVVAGFLVVGAVSWMMSFYFRHQKYIERVEEEKMKKKEDLIKDGGMEMMEKHHVWSPDMIGGPIGQLPVESEFEKEKRREFVLLLLLFLVEKRQNKTRKDRFRRKRKKRRKRRKKLFFHFIVD